MNDFVPLVLVKSKVVQMRPIKLCPDQSWQPCYSEH